MSKTNTSSNLNLPLEIYKIFAKNNLTQIAYVPDAGHKSLIEYCEKDDKMKMISLTTEEEGMGLLAGAWLGGDKGTVLMQSSGLGNCINALASITISCNFPLLMVITMRGEWNEFNPWQVPMGSSTEKVLSALNIVTTRCNYENEVTETVNAMLGLAYKSNCVTAVLLSQRLIGAKSFME